VLEFTDDPGNVRSWPLILDLPDYRYHVSGVSQR